MTVIGATAGASASSSVAAESIRSNRKLALTTIARMLLAAVGDTAYNIMLVLHVITAMAAFAPAFVHPVLAGQSKVLDETNQSKVLGLIAANGRRIYAPALILTGVFGFGVAGMSGGAYELSQGWLVGAIVMWIAMNGVLHAVLLPAERRWSTGDPDAERTVSAAGAAMTVMLVAMLYLMVFKPGL